MRRTRQAEQAQGIKRITGRALQRIRDRVLCANPICVICNLRAATQVDHIVALCNGGDDDPHDDSNRQGLCDRCHDVKTAADLGYEYKTVTGPDGWPIDP